MTTVTYEKRDAIGIVTLRKPPHNLMDAQMLRDIAEQFRLAVQEGCRCILLNSAMRHFCVGADVTQFRDGWRGPDNDELQGLIAAIEDVPVPTVAAVQGTALGGGFELALWCDFIVASDTAVMGLPESSLGLIPLLGGVQRVVQRAGAGRAKEITMLARRHDAKTFEKWGLVNLVTSEAEIAEASLSFARQLSVGATVSMRCIKTLAQVAVQEGVQAADRRQIAITDLMWASADAKSGIEAYLATGPGTGAFVGQ